MKPNAQYFTRTLAAAVAVAEASRREWYALGAVQAGTGSKQAHKAAKRERRNAVTRYALLSIGVDPDMTGDAVYWWARRVCDFEIGKRKADAAAKRWRKLQGAKHEAKRSH